MNQPRSGRDWRSITTSVLQKLLRYIETYPSPIAVLRAGGQRLWQKEIHFPGYLVAVLSVLVFSGILLLDIGFSWLKIAGVALMLGMVLSFMIAFLMNEEPEIARDGDAVMLLGLLLMGAMLLMQLCKARFSPLAAPVPGFVLLAGLLLSRRLALAVAVILCLSAGVLNNFSMELFFVHLVGSLVAVAVIPGLRNRWDINRAGLLLASATVGAILAIYCLRSWPLAVLQKQLLWGALGGGASGLLVLLILPFLESFFSRTTGIRLLELADFNQKLLRQLMIEAPGTYHHALITASLAEQAARAIGANSLLARVAAYYHDIGKLANPAYFIENQQPGLNPHGLLQPTMSSLIVTAHVKDGVLLARQHGIDRVISDCIEQHHGTSLIHFFYHRALEHNPEINPADFRYPGPKPLTREAAILMIADSSEAASRSVDDPTAARLRDVVEKVVNNKFIDGQFSDCPITMRDLDRIVDSMVSTLSGIYHPRIDYGTAQR